MAIPLISELLERFFGPAEDPHSRDDVKRRLKIVLAHDRLALDPQTLEMMRQEIIAVVSRYVEVDFDALEFSLATDQRMTALTANLPIRRIRPLGKGADQPIESDAEVEKIELASQSEISAMDEEAETALQQAESKPSDDRDPIHSPSDLGRTDPDEEDTSEVLSDEAIALKSTESTDETSLPLQESSEESEPDVPDMSEPDAAVETVGSTNQDVTS